MNLFITKYIYTQGAYIIHMYDSLYSNINKFHYFGLQRLATCYWYSVEFGLVREGGAGGEMKAYGAGEV